MAVQVEDFTTDLASLGDTSYTYTTTFAADLTLGQIAIRAKAVSASDGRSAGGQSPVFQGIQETVEIWLDSGAGEDYDVLLQASSFNGKQHFVWAPEDGKQYLLDSGSKLRIVITNKYNFGELFGTVTVNTL